MPQVSAYLSGFCANHKEAVSLSAEGDSLQRGMLCSILFLIICPLLLFFVILLRASQLWNDKSVWIMSLNFLITCYLESNFHHYFKWSNCSLSVFPSLKSWYSQASLPHCRNQFRKISPCLWFYEYSTVEKLDIFLSKSKWQGLKCMETF